MVASAFGDSPWPQQTPAPSSSKRKRRRQDDAKEHPSLHRRQSIFNQSGVEDAETQCEIDSGNEVISCFPTESTIVPQHEWASFVWNSRRPQLAQTNKVNIYLFQAGSNNQVVSFLDYDNPTDRAGSVAAQVNDSWFPGGGLGWSGKNISYPLYWVLTRADAELDGSQIPQSIFTAVQTTFADSVTSSIASVSSRSVASTATASLASASIAAISSASVLSMSRASASVAQTAASQSSSSPGSVQHDGGGGFPHWAIAVIVVLGFLAIVAIGTLAFLIMRRLRRQNQSSQRNSMGSASPMMPGALAAGAPGEGPQSPAMEEAGHRLYDPPVSVGRATSFGSPNDDASMISHAQSQAQSAGDSGLFSGADAAIMADAFRKVLRKPDFAGRPIQEGDSPESQEAPRDEELMNWQLSQEGRDLRSVGSSRGVTVEQSDTDGASTVHEPPH